MNKVNTIMIIDDDPDDRNIFHEAVNEVNPAIRFSVASSGEQAMQRLLNDDRFVFPDLIFLDLNMPRINGIECLRKIKKEKKLAHIPVIIYSTTMNPDDERLAKEAGALNFLPKPLLFSEICDSITAAINAMEKDVSE